jgi:hypothetical protein
MLVWPEFLRVPMGLVQMSAPRFVALCLFLSLLARGRHRELRMGWVDTLVILGWLWTIFATIAAGADFDQSKQMMGRGLDTLLMFFVARMALRGPEDMKGFYVGLAVAAMVMCAAGVYEAVSWRSPYHRFSSGDLRVEGYEEVRFGMLRAQATTLNSIYFGVAMVLISGLIWAVRGFVENQSRHKLFTLVAVVATLSSLSSGPWLALFALIGLSLYFYRPSLIKPSLYLLMVLAIVLELVSNRHFYNLIDYFALDKQTAWYRTRLLEIAVSRWQDYWLVGVGSNWPHHWAAMLDGRQHIDVVNNFLIIALYGGLPALTMFLISHFLAVKRSVRAFRSDQDVSRRKLIFACAATLLAIDFSGMSVGLFGPALLLSYLLLGMIASVTTAWQPVQGMKAAISEPEWADRNVSGRILGSE